MEVVFPLPSPPNGCHGKERARRGKEGERGHRVTCVISVKKLDNCPRLRLVNLLTFRLGVLFPRPGNIISGLISCSSECLNQMHKEEKSFVKEKSKKNSISKSSRKSDKKTEKQCKFNKCYRQFSIRVQMREYRAWKKTLQNTLLMPSLRDGNAIETLLMTAQINTDLVNHPVPSTTEPSTSLLRVGTDARKAFT
ncbi:uncharacterized protein TNCV_4657321 [Trichonephila clavipes]|nr:uncharacterized protein TNCV_4657321 [Trichonephila clavipes]